MSDAAIPGPALDVDEAIGLNVHAMLYRRKASQKQLAFALGITPSVLSKKLRGESAWSARQVAVTAGYLGTRGTNCHLLTLGATRAYAHPMTEAAPDDSLITAQQVADILGCSLRTVERIQADGDLTPVYLPMKRRARARRFRLADVEAFRGAEQATA